MRPGRMMIHAAHAQNPCGPRSAGCGFPPRTPVRKFEIARTAATTPAAMSQMVASRQATAKAKIAPAAHVAASRSSHVRRDTFNSPPRTLQAFPAA